MSRMMDDESRRIVEYLGGLPHGAAVRWSTHHLTADEPWASRWVDVRIDDDVLRMNWVWTILGEDDPDGPSPNQLWDFVWPFDLDVHEVWDPVRPPKVVGERVGSWVVPRGAPAPKDAADALRDAPRGVERTHVVLGGWSAETIGDAIAHWTATHAGRPDLRFEWDPEGEPTARRGRSWVRARRPSGGPSRRSGPGIDPGRE